MRNLALAVLLAAAPVAAAEPPPLDRRVGTLEAQIKALQRQVSPKDARFLTPDIAPEEPAAEPEGTPATAPITDLTARVDAIERQQRTLTGAVEEAQNGLRQLSEAFTKYRGDTDFRLNAIEHPVAAPPPVADPQPAPAADKPAKVVRPSPLKPDPAAAPAPAATLPVEDQWRAAYALYTAKDYAKAARAMTDFLAANPKTARASNAEYWLGRSYMAQDSFAQGAKAFLDGYKKYPTGDRAPDSLVWLGNALTALKKPKEACQAYDEVPASYGDKLTPALKAALAKGREAAKCG